jgi:large-conductance mechanosensitive channel
MIFRLLAMLLQLLAFATIVYVAISLFNRKKRQIQREEILDEHNERLKDEQLQQQLRGEDNNEQK